MKISIITVCFNNDTSIEETILSVLNQTYQDIEYIVIDGESTDKTLGIVKKYEDKISKIISEKDNGIYDALNKGILNSTGKIIGFLHADDIYAENTIIEKIANGFNKSNSDGIYADLLYVDQNNTDKIIRNWKSGQFEYSNLKKGWMPPHPTFYVKKEIYDKFGNFNTNYKIAADYDLMLRFLGKHKISVSYLPAVMVKMRMGGESNKSIKNIVQKMKEDYRAMKTNQIGGVLTLIRKNTSKISQFF